MKNVNVLEGISCPRCGNDDEFRVLAEVTVQVTDDGTGTDDSSHYNWDDEAWTLCTECEFEAVWGTFHTDAPAWTAAKEGA